MTKLFLFWLKDMKKLFLFILRGMKKHVFITLFLIGIPLVIKGGGSLRDAVIIWGGLVGFFAFAWGYIKILERGFRKRKIT